MVLWDMFEIPLSAMTTVNRPRKTSSAEIDRTAGQGRAGREIKSGATKGSHPILLRTGVRLLAAEPPARCRIALRGC